eukprot:1185569-Prorocentrum_minimum.AAC.2
MTWRWGRVKVKATVPTPKSFFLQCTWQVLHGCSPTTVGLCYIFARDRLGACPAGLNGRATRTLSLGVTAFRRTLCVCVCQGAVRSITSNRQCCNASHYSHNTTISRSSVRVPNHPLSGGGHGLRAGHANAGAPARGLPGSHAGAMNPPARTVNPPPEAVKPSPEAVKPPSEAVKPPPEAVNPLPEAVNPLPEAVNPPREAVNPPREAVNPPP